MSLFAGKHDIFSNTVNDAVEAETRHEWIHRRAFPGDACLICIHCRRVFSWGMLTWCPIRHARAVAAAATAASLRGAAEDGAQPPRRRPTSAPRRSTPGGLRQAEWRLQPAGPPRLNRPRHPCRRAAGP